MSRDQALAGGAALLLLGALMARAPLQFDLAGVLLAALAVALELAAVPLPGFGFFSAAPAAYLGLLWLPGDGPAACALTVAAALVARGLARGGWGSAVADSLPPLGAALSVALGAPLLLALNLYLVLLWAVPAWLASPGEALWRRARGRLALLWLGAALTGPALGLLGPSGMWLVPILVALHLGAERAIVNVRVDEREELRQALRRSRDLREKLSRDFHARAEESVLRQELGRELSRRNDVQGTLQTLAETAAGLAPSRNVAVFAGDRALLFRSRQPERVESAPLLGLREPILNRSLAEGKPLFLETSPSPERIFSEDTRCAAIPLDQGVVLYLGRGEAEPGFSRAERRALGLLAEQALTALEAARRFDQLASQAWRGRLLEGSVQRLESLLEATAGLTASLDQEQLLEAVEQGAQRLAPHRKCAVVEQGRVPRGWHPEQMALRVAESARPLLIEQVGGTPYESDLPEGGCLLGCPLVADDRPLAVLVLAAPAGSFSRDQVDSLALFCRAAGLAWRNAALHRQVAQALEDLRVSQAQLVNSSKLAAIGQLAAGVAHELNTPLGSIVLALDSLRDETDSPVLAVAMRSAERARQIIANLLFYSREGSEAPHSYDLNTVVRDTLELLERQLGKDGLTLRLELQPLPALYGRPGQIQQVVTNLLLNARDACLEAGASLVTISTAPEEGRVVLRVEDEGPGVDPAIADRIFDPFFTTKPVGRGTGLGLSLSQQIVLAEGGSLELEHPDQGARFAMRLPHAP